MDRDAMLRRLDELREAIEAGKVACVSLVAVGEAFTVSIVGEMPDAGVMHGSALALLAHMLQCVEVRDPGDSLDVLASGSDPEPDEPEPDEPGGGLN